MPFKRMGAAGIHNELPLTEMYLGVRTLRLADCPDEVHKVLIAENIIHRYEIGETWTLEN